jgi:hypothetical protein
LVLSFGVGEEARGILPTAALGEDEVYNASIHVCSASRNRTSRRLTRRRDSRRLGHAGDFLQNDEDTEESCRRVVCALIVWKKSIFDYRIIAVVWFCPSNRKTRNIWQSNS